MTSGRDTTIAIENKKYVFEILGNVNINSQADVEGIQNLLDEVRVKNLETHVRKVKEYSNYDAEHASRNVTFEKVRYTEEWVKSVENVDPNHELFAEMWQKLMADANASSYQIEHRHLLECLKKMDRFDAEALIKISEAFEQIMLQEYTAKSLERQKVLQHEISKLEHEVSIFTGGVIFLKRDNLERLIQGKKRELNELENLENSVIPHITEEKLTYHYKPSFIERLSFSKLEQLFLVDKTTTEDDEENGEGFTYGLTTLGYKLVSYYKPSIMKWVKVDQS